jgi:hypothetical protein
MGLRRRILLSPHYVLAPHRVARRGRAIVARSASRGPQSPGGEEQAPAAHRPLSRCRVNRSPTTVSVAPRATPSYKPHRASGSSIMRCRNPCSCERMQGVEHQFALTQIEVVVGRLVLHSILRL